MLHVSESTNAQAHVVCLVCVCVYGGGSDLVINCSFVSLENHRGAERASGQNRHISIFKRTLLSQHRLPACHMDSTPGRSLTICLCFYSDLGFKRSPPSEFYHHLNSPDGWNSELR